jgi:hypothetical protein
MSKTHRFTAIPSAARESILVRLFKGEPIDVEDDDTEVLAGSCSQIIHRIFPRIQCAVSVEMQNSGIIK